MGKLKKNEIELLVNDWIKEIEEDLARFIFNCKRIEWLEISSGFGYDRDNELLFLKNQNEQLESRYNQIRSSVAKISDFISESAIVGKSEILNLKAEVSNQRERLESLYRKSNRSISDVLECDKIENSITDFKKKEEELSNKLHSLEECISDVEKFKNFLVSKGFLE